MGMVLLMVLMLSLLMVLNAIQEGMIYVILKQIPIYQILLILNVSILETMLMGMGTLISQIPEI